MVLSQLISKIQSDPALDPGSRDSLLSLLGELIRINPNMSRADILGAIGGGLMATVLSRYLNMSSTGQAVTGAAGIGLGLTAARRGDLFTNRYINSAGQPWSLR